MHFKWEFQHNAPRACSFKPQNVYETNLRNLKSLTHFYLYQIDSFRCTFIIDNWLNYIFFFKRQTMSYRFLLLKNSQKERRDREREKKNGMESCNQFEQFFFSLEFVTRPKDMRTEKKNGHRLKVLSLSIGVLDCWLNCSIESKTMGSIDVYAMCKYLA